MSETLSDINFIEVGPFVRNIFECLLNRQFSFNLNVNEYSLEFEWISKVNINPSIKITRFKRNVMIEVSVLRIKIVSREMHNISNHKHCQNTITWTGVIIRFEFSICCQMESCSPILILYSWRNLEISAYWICCGSITLKI